MRPKSIQSIDARKEDTASTTAADVRCGAPTRLLFAGHPESTHVVLRNDALVDLEELRGVGLVQNVLLQRRDLEARLDLVDDGARVPCRAYGVWGLGFGVWGLGWFRGLRFDWGEAW